MRIYWLVSSAVLLSWAVALAFVGSPWSWTLPAIYGACCLGSGIVDSRSAYARGYSDALDWVSETARRLARGPESDGERRTGTGRCD
jgi:hypothetical protein